MILFFYFWNNNISFLLMTPLSWDKRPRNLLHPPTQTHKCLISIIIIMNNNNKPTSTCTSEIMIRDYVPLSLHSYHPLIWMVIDKSLKIKGHNIKWSLENMVKVSLILPPSPSFPFTSPLASSVIIIQGDSSIMNTIFSSWQPALLITVHKSSSESWGVYSLWTRKGRGRGIKGEGERAK